MLAWFQKDKARLEQDQGILEEESGEARLQGFQEGNMNMSMEGEQEAAPGGSIKRGHNLESLHVHKQFKSNSINS